MLLPQPTLQKRTFDDLIAEATAVLPRLAPAWTDYNAHDPGVTLVELFAWLVEMDLYRAGRTPDATVRAFLRWLGAEPRPALAAETVLALTHESSAAARVLVPAGTRVVDADLQIVFETTEPTIVGPPLTALYAQGTIVTNGDGCEPFGSAAPIDAALYLGFDHPLTGSVTLFIATALPAADMTLRENLAELAATGAPNSILARAFDPSRHYAAHTVWEQRSADGTWREIATVVDETRALTLAGFVRFTIAEPHLAGGPDAARYFVRCRLARGGYDRPPTIQRVIAHAVNVRHAASHSIEQLGFSSGRARQRFGFRHAPVVPGSIRLQCVLPSDTGDGTTWSEQVVWDRVGPHDTAFVLSADRSVVELGDGRVGRVPPAGAELRAAYKTGAGVAGNIAAGRLDRTIAVASGARILLNQPFAAWGGADAEAIADARARASAERRAPDRAVTLDDLQTLARTAPGLPVARAWAIPERHPALPGLVAPGCVTLVVLAQGIGSGATPRSELLDAVAARIDAVRPLCTEVHVIAPRLVTVVVDAALIVAPDADGHAILAAARVRLASWLDAIHGGLDGAGWTPGRPVARAEVLAVLAAVPGVVAVGALTLRLDDDRPRHCGDLALCFDTLPISGAHGLRLEGNRCR
jgi:predicted phage baseplate assembly protein